MIMDGNLDTFEDIIDEIEEDICVEDDFDDEMEDIAYVSIGGNSGEDDMFDAVVGKLEEIIMDEDFNAQTTEFMRRNCVHFERGDELKLEYTEVFQQYTTLIEEHVERGLREGIPDFCMETFLGLLEARQDEISADVFDMLLSMSDFELFKEQMVDYREQCVERTRRLLVYIRATHCVAYRGYGGWRGTHGSDGWTRCETTVPQRWTRLARWPTAIWDASSDRLRLMLTQQASKERRHHTQRHRNTDLAVRFLLLCRITNRPKNKCRNVERCMAELGNGSSRATT